MLRFTDILQLNNLTTCFVFFFTLVVLYVHTKRRYGIPPGPNCWPVVGNMFSLFGKDTLKNLSDLRRRYGDIYGLYIGHEVVIVLNGYDCIHEALVKHGTLFAMRPTNHRLSDVSIVYENGKVWKNNRAFVVKVFHDLFFSRKGVSLEDRIHSELSFLVEKLDTFEKPIDVSGTITYSLANVIYSIIHGKRLDYEHKRLLWYLNTLELAFETFAKDQVLLYCFPFLHRLPINLLKLKYAKITEELKEHFAFLCNETVEQYDEGNETCLIHYYISSIGGSNIGRSDSVAFEGKLWVMLHDLMAAGSETTATTLKWIIFFMISQPDIQEKLHKEIEKCVCQGQAPSYSDRKEMPYVEATILEALRIGNIVPLAMPHTVPCDIMFKGYVIPKGATILPNLASVHMDPNFFSEPEIFKPERFLSADGKQVISSEKLIPFSLGPRSCIGETLARMELFLYLTTLVQNFEFKNPEGQDVFSVRGVFGITHSPGKYKIEILKRGRRIPNPGQKVKNAN